MLINDNETAIAGRNLVLLLILGGVDDGKLAADMAIHFWYSDFMPDNYKARISSLIAAFLAHAAQERFVLGRLSDCSFPFSLSSQLKSWLADFELWPILTDEARGEYLRSQAALHGEDVDPKSSSRNRAAAGKFRQTGIVLPFGADDTQFDAPNPSLFNLYGQWLQNERLDPLDGWWCVVLLGHLFRASS